MNRPALASYLDAFEQLLDLAHPRGVAGAAAVERAKERLRQAEARFSAETMQGLLLHDPRPPAPRPQNNSASSGDRMPDSASRVNTNKHKGFAASQSLLDAIRADLHAEQIRNRSGRDAMEAVGEYFGVKRWGVYQWMTGRSLPRDFSWPQFEALLEIVVHLTGGANIIGLLREIANDAARSAGPSAQAARASLAGIMTAFSSLLRVVIESLDDDTITSGERMDIEKSSAACANEIERLRAVIAALEHDARAKLASKRSVPHASGSR